MRCSRARAIGSVPAEALVVLSESVGGVAIATS
jgi:hypothetical protein